MLVVLHEIDLLYRFTSAQIAATAVGLRFTACPQHLLLQHSGHCRSEYARCGSLEDALTHIRRRQQELALTVSQGR
jgi:hypothetical protein